MTLPLDTHQKALSINLDPNIYGAFAEIGAGQEVARWFFRVGGAAGTLAKTMSAYDMKVSDDIYGKVERYVSRERLEHMLDHEYGLLVERLGNTRGGETRFFAFADTVSARNFKGTNQCHGWLGIRFQCSPGGEPHDIILHVNLKDSTNLAQQEAVGALGVNLVYAAFHHCSQPDLLVKSLLDDLALERVELDLMECRGSNFRDLDSVSLGHKMLQGGVSALLIFAADGSLLVPPETVYKRPLLIERGAFREAQGHHRKLLDEASTKLEAELSAESRPPLPMFELSLGRIVDELSGEHESSSISQQQFAQRLMPLLQLGCPVIVSRHAEYYRLVQHLRDLTKEPLGFVMGIGTMIRIFDPRNYTQLEGNVLEALGRLVSLKVRVYVRPMERVKVEAYLAQHGLELDAWNIPSAGDIAVDNISPKSEFSHLYDYLSATDVLVPL